MRVTKQLISTTNACALYNKGVSRVVVPVACNANKAIEVLKKENKEKMLNYLDIPNNCILSLSLSLSHSTITLSFLTVYVLTQCVARDSVLTKDLLIVPFVVCCFCLINSFFSYTLIGTMLTRMGKVPFTSLPLQVNVVSCSPYCANRVN